MHKFQTQACILLSEQLALDQCVEILDNNQTADERRWKVTAWRLEGYGGT